MTPNKVMSARPVRKRPLQVAIVAGEPSGDLLAAGLMRAMRKQCKCKFSGVGGNRMRAAGCKLLFDMQQLNIIGLDGLVSKLPGILRLKQQLLRAWRRNPPDIFIGVDAPDFNLPLARQLKKCGVPCVHYVSPTVWAWRGYRVNKIRDSIDHMLALFPFEADFYRRHNIAVDCVGHPMADEIDQPNRARARRALRIDGAPLIALLPGSRRGEMRRHGALLLDAAQHIMRDMPNARFVLPLANDAVADEFAHVTPRPPDPPIRVVRGKAREALEACDFAVLASGTAALEAALLRRAHIVVYRVAPLAYWLIQRLRHVDYYSMPNQLLPAPTVPELIQRRATAANIARESQALWGDVERRELLETQFAQVHAALKQNTNERAAEIVLRLAHAGDSQEDVQVDAVRGASQSVKQSASQGAQQSVAQSASRSAESNAKKTAKKSKKKNVQQRTKQGAQQDAQQDANQSGKQNAKQRANDNANESAK